MKIESINKFINHCNKVKELGISYSDYEVLHVYKGYFSTTFNKIKNSKLEDSIIAKASAAYESNKRRKQSLDSNPKTETGYERDEEGKIAYYTYKIYKNKPPTVITEPMITEYYDEDGGVIPVVLYELEAMDDLDEDFINGFDTLNAENIIVFPNNKNIVLAAKQAAKIYKESKVWVIETKTIAATGHSSRYTKVESEATADHPHLRSPQWY